LDTTNASSSSYCAKVTELPGDTWLRLRLRPVNSAGLAASEAALLTLADSRGSAGAGRPNSLCWARQVPIGWSWPGPDRPGRNGRLLGFSLAWSEASACSSWSAAANRGSLAEPGHSVRPESGLRYRVYLTARTLAGDGPPSWLDVRQSRLAAASRGSVFFCGRPAKRAA
uniref:Fibronectin type-III domain-containing protein n=1 Tax=Macrostomum lignano TaxID=282301 RepID=A0A1I8FN91_9PLAT